LASQRAAGRPDMHLRRVISMMRETRCSQVERTHDQVEQ
jgi:hypothetical protein